MDIYKVIKRVSQKLWVTEERNKEIILEHIRLNYLVDIKVKMLGRQLYVFGVQKIIPGY